MGWCVLENPEACALRRRPFVGVSQTRDDLRLEPFRGEFLSKVDKPGKIDFEIPPRRALRGSHSAAPPPPSSRGCAVIPVE